MSILFIVGKIISAVDLAHAKDSRVLLDSHKASVNWWASRNIVWQRCVDFVAGRHWTSEENAAARLKNKTLRTFNLLKPAERTLVGNFLLGKWDVKWTPDGGSRHDEKLVAALEALRIRDAKMQSDYTLDADLYGLVWTAGTSSQEIDIRYSPGCVPVMSTKNLNKFAVYWDPNSREPIRRRDAQFVDVVGWYTADQLCKAFPDRKEWIAEHAKNRGGPYNGWNSATYVDFNIATDRAHETNAYRNGQYKVVERFYRISREDLGPEEIGPSISPVTGRPFTAKGVEHCEELWYAVSVEDFGVEFLYNGRYHFQPVNPFDGTTMWPIVELIWEHLNGEIQSAVQHELDPAIAFDAMLTNILHVVKHQSSSGLLIDKSAFIDENEANNAKKYHADADRGFMVKNGRASNAVFPIPKSTASNDIYQGLQYARTTFDEIGSVPPAMQGTREGNESGILFQQRVERSAVQLAPSQENYRLFLEQKYLLRYVLQRQYYSQEMEVQILEPTEDQRKSGQTSVTVNQAVPAKDQYGFEIPGQVDYLNDVDSMLYHLSVSPSTRTPTQRLKTQAQLSEISQSPAAANDAGLGSIILEAQIDLSDLDPKYKDKIEQWRQGNEQAAQAAQQAQAAEAQAQQAKGQAATTMSQAQAQLASATAQNLQAQIQFKGQELQMKAQDQQIKVQDSQVKNQQATAKMQMEMQKMGIEVQKMQSDTAAQQGIDQTEMMTKRLEFRKLELEVEKQKSDLMKQANDLQLKQLDLEIRKIELGSAHISAVSDAHKSAMEMSAPVGQQQ